MPLLEGRGAEFCRACGSRQLASVLDLGSQPIANRLLKTPDDRCSEYPLHLRICTECFLGQVGDVLDPSEIFSDYPYLSSVSSSWLNHSAQFATSQSAQLRKDSHEYVLEVASNDGYLLREFHLKGYSVLGVEPAENVAELARQSGIPTISEFFGEALARKIRARYRSPSLVVANNVFAHVPDIVDFASGLREVCDHKTRISIENPSLLSLLQDTQFDTIYHEHFSYLTVHAVKALAESVGLQVFDVEYIPTHGGSNRYWLSLPGAYAVAPSVSDALIQEVAGGLTTSTLWHEFESRSNQVLADLRAWLQTTTPGSVAAYGAAAKGNTLLNAVGELSSTITAVFDGSHEKIGKYLPGSRLPIRPSSEFEGNRFTDVLILPWNIVGEIAAQLLEIDPSIRLWRAIPRLERVE